MGLSAKARSTAGTVRAFPTLGRRVFHAEQKLDTLHEQAAIVELGRRVAALEQQVESLHATLTSTDPQITLEIVTAVRSQVVELSTGLTEQMNRTSDLLIELSGCCTADNT